MSLRQWQSDGWVRPHKSSRQEIAALFGVIERDLKASQNPSLDDDWRFAIAYNAALQCAAAALKAAGYDVPKGGGTHFGSSSHSRKRWATTERLSRYSNNSAPSEGAASTK